jgi:hypothetical protein
MLVHQSTLCTQQAAIALRAKLLAQIPSYHPFLEFERLNSWAIASYPDLVLMEGQAVGKHTDGGSFWQPLLILQNPSASWSFRGAYQKVTNLYPQIAGTFIVLDVERSHCVSGRKSTPWVALCWNPHRSVSKKADFSLEAIISEAKDQFSQLIKPFCKS